MRYVEIVWKGGGNYASIVAQHLFNCPNGYFKSHDQNRTPTQVHLVWTPGKVIQHAIWQQCYSTRQPWEVCEAQGNNCQQLLWILSSISFHLCKSKAADISTNNIHSINIYLILVGYPGMGKSDTIQHPLQDNSNQCLLSKHTSLCFINHLASYGTVFIVSSEIFDMVNKLLRLDNKTSEDAMLVFKLFFRRT